MKNENLNQAVTKLLEDLKVSNAETHPSLAKYWNFTADSGRKFIKIIQQDTFNVAAGGEMSERVWGFINISEFTKERKMANSVKTVTFKEGDVLMANGGRAPALNSARGNLLEGYIVNGSNRIAPTYL
jgi:hypothetical protein